VRLPLARIVIVLAAVAILMLKHAVADFYLQSSYQYMNKGTYGHPGGIIHSAIHVALTPLVYLVIAPASLLPAGLARGAPMRTSPSTGNAHPRGIPSGIRAPRS